MKEKSYFIYALCVIFAAILWGLDGVVLTPRLYNLDLNFVVFLLHLVPFILMQFVLYKEWKYLRKFTQFELFGLFSIALFGGILGTLSIVKALFLVNFNGLTVVALIQKLQPIFALILAYFFLKEKPKKYFFIFAVIAFIATYPLIFGFSVPNFSYDRDYILAMLYALLAAFSFGSATILGKYCVNNLPFQTVTFYRFGITAFLMFFIVLFTGHIYDFSLVTKENWQIILLIAFTTGSGAIFLYYYGLQKIPAMTATLSELFFPLATVLFDFIMNDRIITPVQIGAAIIIVACIIRINFLKE